MWETVTGYVVLLGFGVGLTYYYNPDAFKKFIPETVVQPIEEARQAKKPKQKRVNKLDADEKSRSNPVSSSEAPASKKRKIVSAPVSDTVKAETIKGSQTSIPRVEDDSMNNAEFARQLQQAQAGTKLEKNIQAGPNKKERRATKPTGPAQSFDSPELSGEASSTGGRDADDDMSPVDTPPSSVSRAGDVSDMLEPGPAKPATLRLTSTDAAPTKKAPKQFEEVKTTKKQRQRQKQQEQNRELREAADKIHEEKKMKQISGARTADGSSKQIKATNFTQNAWQQKPAQQQTPSQPPVTGSLLDTFEPERRNTKSAISTKQMSDITNKPQANVEDIKESLGEKKTQALAASEREAPAPQQNNTSAAQYSVDANEQWEKELVEDQQWESVTSKKSKKKAKKDSDTGSEASQPVAQKPVASKPNGVQTKPNHVSSIVRPEVQNRFESMAGSDWEA